MEQREQLERIRQGVQKGQTELAKQALQRKQAEQAEHTEHTEHTEQVIQKEQTKQIKQIVQIGQTEQIGQMQQAKQLQQRKQKKKIGWLLFLVAFLASFWLLQRLVMPKYQSSLLEGALIREYYASPKTHDLLFFGDCEVYESFSPRILEEETGLSSFIRGSASQRIWQSYYLMEETLSYETPDIFVFNVLAMQYDEPVREEYNRMTLDGMRWSQNKLRSIQASKNPDESLLSYLFPLLRYHDRWSELTAEDVTCLFHTRPVSEQGYLPQEGVKPAGTVPEGKPLADYQFPKRCYSYLDRMRMLCEEHGITLILVKAPSLYPYWYPEWEEQIKDYAKTYELPYFNFLEKIQEIGIDYQTDTYDAGLHLNRSGAEKLTRYFARCLKDRSE